MAKNGFGRPVPDGAGGRVPDVMAKAAAGAAPDCEACAARHNGSGTGREGQGVQQAASRGACRGARGPGPGTTRRLRIYLATPRLRGLLALWQAAVGVSWPALLGAGC